MEVQLPVVSMQSRFETHLSHFVTNMKSIRYNPSHFGTNNCVCKHKPEVPQFIYNRRLCVLAETRGICKLPRELTKRLFVKSESHTSIT